MPHEPDAADAVIALRADLVGLTYALTLAMFDPHATARHGLSSH